MPCRPLGEIICCYTWHGHCDEISCCYKCREDYVMKLDVVINALKTVMELFVGINAMETVMKLAVVIIALETM